MAGSVPAPPGVLPSGAVPQYTMPAPAGQAVQAGQQVMMPGPHPTMAAAPPGSMSAFGYQLQHGQWGLQAWPASGHWPAMMLAAMPAAIPAMSGAVPWVNPAAGNQPASALPPAQNVLPTNGTRPGNSGGKGPAANAFPGPGLSGV
ncbi:hypothetical protein CBR_g16007 [Chara braunii]|uniref:Uncharacterized protein n=1 Tax=Chara braunii TaxID=69332 RepID=A0A388JT02_CHABU|nr:hypothetical protein CBR_g16007 [Chara braunii]|eukprot:GBG60887.1 hypothetical protein CBR_g16007 [Chara braunii]